jgi:hypothetical protein
MPALGVPMLGNRGSAEGGGKVVVVILVIVAFVIIINNASIGYRTVQVDLSGVITNKTEICDEYISSKCVQKCVDNVPVCKCEASVLHQMFFAPGDYPR